MGKQLYILVLILSAIVLRANDFGESAGAPSEKEASRHFKIPAALEREHKGLHERLLKATQSGGATGKAAETVAALLHAHFQREEQFALPPLALLPQVSSGTVTREMEQVLPLTEKMKAELPEMLKEHKKIVAALDKLKAAATAEDKREVVQFADDLKRHATMEEQVLYPATILIGETIKAKLKP